MSILVLGQSSFIAKNIARSDLEAQFVHPKNHFQNQKDLSDFIQTIPWGKHSTIVNCLGTPPQASPKELELLHVDLPRLILENSLPKQRLVFFGSAAEYGKPSELPLRETSPMNPVSDYGKAKYKLTCNLRAHPSSRGIYYLRPFNLFGFDQPSYNLCSKILSQILEGLPKNKITLINPDLKRDFLPVEMLVSFIHKISMLPEKTGFHEYNLCSGQSLSVGEFTHYLLEGIFKEKPKPEIIHFFDDQKTSPIPEVYGDPSAWTKLLCLEKPLPLERWISTFAQNWFQDFK